jgi:hypothetical protein
MEIMESIRAKSAHLRSQRPQVNRHGDINNKISIHEAKSMYCVYESRYLKQNREPYINIGSTELKYT